MGAALFMTMSRGGIFSFISGLLFMAVLVLTRKSIRKKGWILSAVAILIILTIAWLGATPVVERVLSIKVEIVSRYFGGRLPIWQGTIDIIKDYLIFGTGFGTFNYIFPQYQPLKIITEHYTYAHSDFLELLSEVGIAGFSIFLSGLIVFAGYGFKRFYKRHDPYVIGMSIGIFGSLVSIFVHSFTDFSLHIPANAILLTIILSLFLSLLNYKHDGVLLFHFKTYLLKPITCYALYPVAVLLVSIFIVTSSRPAIADYYYRKSKDDSRFTIHDSRELLSRAIAFDPTNAVYHYQLGKLYSKDFTKYDMTKENPELSQRIQNTIDAYKEAVRLNPSNSKYHQSLAWTYGILADLNKRNTIDSMRITKLAHEHFQEAIILEPNNAYRHRTYAIWLFDHPTEKNIEKGVIKYKKAVGLKSKFAEEAFNRYYKLTNNYDLLSNIVPDTIEGHFLLRKFYEKKELHDKSSKEKKILLAKLSDFSYRASSDIYFRHGVIYESLGLYDRAESKYKKALKLNPRRAWNYYKMGTAHLRKKRIQQAIEFFLDSLEVDSSFQLSYHELAQIYKSQGKKLEAERMWRAVLALKNPHPDVEKIARRELKIND